MEIWEGGEDHKSAEGCRRCTATRGRTQFLWPWLVSSSFSVIKWRARREGAARDVPGKFTTPKHYPCNAWMLTQPGHELLLLHLAQAPPQLVGCCSAVSISTSWPVVSLTLAPDFERTLTWEENNKYMKSEFTWLLKSQWGCGLLSAELWQGKWRLSEEGISQAEGIFHCSELCTLLQMVHGDF